MAPVLMRDPFLPAASAWAATLPLLPTLVRPDAPERLDGGVGVAIPTEEPPLLVTADVVNGSEERSATWLVWPERLVEEISGDEGDAVSRDVAHLMILIGAFSGLVLDQAPAHRHWPSGTPIRGGRIWCLRTTEAGYSGGLITWAVDDSGGCWWLDPDEADVDLDGEPLPVPMSGLDLMAVLLAYLAEEPDERAAAGAPVPGS